MLLDRLRDAKALRKREMLEPILQKCSDLKLGDHSDVKKSKFILRVVVMKEGMLSYTAEQYAQILNFS